MTPMRRWAMRIAWFVARHASAGSREWATAVAHEVEFVEGDWRALAWALGSLRVLFDRREAPVRSYFELSEAAEKFAEAKRKASNGWKVMPIFVFLYFARSLNAPSQVERFGDILLMIGWIIILTNLYLDRRSRGPIPPSVDVAGVLDFYKRELERLRDVHRSLRGWLMGLMMLFVCLGIPMTETRGTARLHFWTIVSALMLVGVVVGYFHTQRTNRRRLEQMDALPGKQS